MRDQSSRPHVGVAGMRTGLSVLYVAAARAVVCLALFGVPYRAQAQRDAPAQSVHPELRWRIEAPLLAAGAALLVVGKNLSVSRKSVPPEGLDPSDVQCSFDRGVIGERSTRADTQSDYFRDAALAYPMTLAFASQPSRTRVSSTLRRSLMYGEALLVAEGLSKVIKGSADRPRPFTYLPANQRPNNPAYDAAADYAFQSMPSGHAISTFCAAGFAMTDHLISRPDASWKERVGVHLWVGSWRARRRACASRPGSTSPPTRSPAGSSAPLRAWRYRSCIITSAPRTDGPRCRRGVPGGRRYLAKPSESPLVSSSRKPTDVHAGRRRG